ncbi:VacJ family lipoprotein [Thalassotalea sp. 1_MG-2023]|uniref:MlaA family lipoprotein n=1 Tax=Thalassotalea sp. 1_MG-2023 TaxID=3062680 RepID=UPI0026E4599D|nr:VacJ family lipoprotein [Thalassotalea sp. 1_MG-2023]MDO6426490.1 VacJ family lipoprotein [Thalassotalea sp. 1_MG-2023]
MSRSFIHLKSLCIAFATLWLVGCSSTPTHHEGAGDPKDPFETINRPIWTFNWEYADKYVLKPASEAYVNNVDQDFRSGVYNMALNLNEPSAVINNLLQGKFSDAAKSTGRFLLNSTIGLLGFFDPASDFGWGRKHEEFGEVLGSYGVGDGPYLMLPAMGPTSVRDEVGDYVDRYYWPMAVIDFWPNLVRVGIIALEQRAQLKDQEQMLENSTDTYQFVKNAYFQNMKFKVYDGNPPIEESEDDADFEAFMDELDGSEE